MVSQSQKKIIQVSEPELKIPEITKISIIGDPGCDGLGAATMSIFARALMAADGDFTVIVGDVVRRGIKNLYGNVTDFINTVAQNNVFMVCGNHDTAFYNEYFGLRNYVLFNDSLLFVFLDDSRRMFEEGTLRFLENMLIKYSNRKIVLFFHIPPPNSVGTNTISEEEWQKVEFVLKPYRSQVKYIVCGHVHSFYEDDLDGIKLIVSGGGGARIEYVSEKVNPLKAHHHIVQLVLNSEGQLKHHHISLEKVPYMSEIQDSGLQESLEKGLAGEALAHLQYRFFAEDAMEKGFKGLAKMFRAFADAEYYHARNHFYVLSKMDSMLENAIHSINNEDYEINTQYAGDLSYARENGYGLAAYSFHDAREAEKVHQQLLAKAIMALTENKDISEKNYYTCTSCGFTLTGETKVENCPICGAPADKINEVN